MTKPKTQIINLPFSGFYESAYSESIDRAEEQYCEYYGSDGDCGAGEGEKVYPQPLQLTGGELSEIAFMACDYRKAELEVCKDYVAALEQEVSSLLGFKLGLTFESMISPREYNFGTDRIFAHIPAASVRKLLAIAKADNFAALADVLGEELTPRSGFMPFYDNTPTGFLGSTRPADLDHNESAMLLQAAIIASGGEWGDSDFESGLRSDIFGLLNDWNSFDDAWQTGMDWADFERRCADARDVKRAEFEVENPGADLPAPLDPNTGDLFEGLAQ